MQESLGDQVTKAELRERAKRNRNGLHPDSAMVCAGVARWLASPARPTGAVVLYSAMSDEVDVSSLANEARYVDLGPYVVTRTPASGRVLTLHRFDSPTERHRFGYEQPVADAPVVDDAEVGVVLVPALTFDRRGQRLGWGAGFYDRLLARLGPNVVRIGVSDGFIVDSLPSEPHDIAMDFLATESGVMHLPLG